jgi:hypothetical protein
MTEFFWKGGFMPFQHTRKVAPRTDVSALYIADLGASNAVTAIEVPSGAIGVSLWFEAASVKVRGRVGFHSTDQSATLDASDATGTLAHQSDFPEMYSVVGWGTYIHLASSTANASVFGCWYFD